MTFAEEGDYLSEKPEKKTGWAQAGTLTQQDNAKSVQVQANFDEAANYTVEFGMVIPPGTSAAAEALITWTVEGNPINRRVSVSNGLSVTGVGQGVKVVVKDVSTTGNADYDVSLSVARGIRGDTERPPTLYLGFVTINHASNDFFTVPLDSGAQSVYLTYLTTDTTQNPIYAVQVDSAGVLLRAWRLNATGAADWVPLEPGCVKILVFNDSGGGTPLDNVKVFATLGIDG